MQKSVPSPLYRDPIYDGAADPMIIKNEQTNEYFMFYTQRRANQFVTGVSFAHGTAIGVAVSENGADWHYLGALDLNFEFGHNTYWAPEIIYNPDEKLYHMFVTYIRGTYSTWDGKATLEHYTSENLIDWKHLGGLSFGSSRIIDPCIFRLPSGVWRMWYKDENQDSSTCYADSPDLYTWEYVGRTTYDAPQEGPNVFEFEGYYWMISDVWKGLGVYRSDDLTNFTRQEENILREPGNREDDNDRGAHADIIVIKDRAFIVYFTHPDRGVNFRSSIHLAELKVENGILTCDRNEEISVDWTE